MAPMRIKMQVKLCMMIEGRRIEKLSERGGQESMYIFEIQQGMNGT